MFTVLWRFLPGPVWLRLVLLLAVVAGLVYWLAYYGYPLVAQYLPSEESTITE